MDGAVRLTGGSGTPCDPLYTGVVEVFRADVEAWGAVCTEVDPEDRLAADVVCRQLGFPHGTAVAPAGIIPEGAAPSPGADEDLMESFAMRGAACRGVEERLDECRLGEGLEGGCMNKPMRLTVACRQFPVAEALESVVTPGAGAALCRYHATCRAVFMHGAVNRAGRMPLPFGNCSMRFECDHVHQALSGWTAHRVPALKPPHACRGGRAAAGGRRAGRRVADGPPGGLLRGLLEPGLHRRLWRRGG